MRNLILSFLLGAACGAMALWLLKAPPDVPESPVVESAGAGEIRVLKDEIASLSKELERAKSQAAVVATQTKKPEPKVFTKVFGGDTPGFNMEKLQEQMKEREQKRIERKVAAQLATLKGRLNLSAEQEEAVKVILTKKENSSGTSAILSMAFDAAGGGELNPEDILKSKEKGNDYTAGIRALLDEGQATAYDAYLAERRANSIESRANQRLAQLQQQLDLSAEQKDQVFDVFAATADKQVGADGQLDNSAFIGDRAEEKEALQGILSPEQMEVYEQTPQIMSVISGIEMFGDIKDGMEIEVSPAVQSIEIQTETVVE